MPRRYAAWGTLVLATTLTFTLALSLQPRLPRAAGRVPGDLGVVLADPSPEECRRAHIQGGALVVEVIPDGPADREDLREGDIITEFENEKVVSAAELLGRIRRTGAGNLVSIHISRVGKEQWLGLVKLEPRPAPPPSAAAIEDRFIALEQQLDAVRARLDALERVRTIPHKPVAR